MRIFGKEYDDKKWTGTYENSCCKCRIPMEEYKDKTKNPGGSFLISFYINYIGNVKVPIIYKDIVDMEIDNIFASPQESIKNEIYRCINISIRPMRILDRELPGDKVIAAFVERFSFPSKFGKDTNELEYIFKKSVEAGYNLTPEFAAIIGYMYMDCLDKARETCDIYKDHSSEDPAQSIERKIAKEIFKYVESCIDYD